jgi:hypothetical protein
VNLILRTTSLAAEAAELLTEWVEMVEQGHLDREGASPTVLMLARLCRRAERVPTPYPPGKNPRQRRNRPRRKRK